MVPFCYLVWDSAGDLVGIYQYLHEIIRLKLESTDFVEAIYSGNKREILDPSKYLHDAKVDL